jgi:hypothetical protein
VKKITVVQSKEVKTRCSLADFFKEGDGSKRALLSMMNKSWQVYYVNLIFA